VVRALLGEPWSITDGTKGEYGFDRRKSEIRPEVAEEYWYYCAYFPHVWAVCFDNKGRVVDKIELISP